MSNAVTFMKLPVISWIVAANRGEAVIFRGDKNGPFDFVRRIKNPAWDENSRLSMKEEDQEKFAKSLSGDIAASRGEFDELVLVAEPHFLGKLRRHLPGSLKPLVTREFPLDLKLTSNEAMNRKVRKMMAAGRAA